MNYTPRRALLSVSDKSGLIELAHALTRVGTELVATGKTAQMIRDAGMKVTSVESFTGNAEAFGGRMKTLSFEICSGILYRRKNTEDERDVQKLGIKPIDCVVVNFYPFEKDPTVEQIDIGGPTLVRAAAKNCPDVLVLSDPCLYSDVILELDQNKGYTEETAQKCAAWAWDRVAQYDQAISDEQGGGKNLKLRYGENPHQSARLRVEANSPIDWNSITENELSYNNILDLSSAYSLLSALKSLRPDAYIAVVVKHNNPCGVASSLTSMKDAFEAAWAGDPVSAFGSVVVLSHPLEHNTASCLEGRFIELLAAPDLSINHESLKKLIEKKKKLKAIRILQWGQSPSLQSLRVPGGVLVQASDWGSGGEMPEEMRSVTQKPWNSDWNGLARFGIEICAALKSNAVALVRTTPGSNATWQLIGAGQGQPNRVDALERLALPRAKSVSPDLGECILVSDAFFPFRDCVDHAARAGILKIVQPGGSVKDAESIAACDEAGIAMSFTGRRHFKH